MTSIPPLIENRPEQAARRRRTIFVDRAHTQLPDLEVKASAGHWLGSSDTDTTFPKREVADVTGQSKGNGNQAAELVGEGISMVGAPLKGAFDLILGSSGGAPIPQVSEEEKARRRAAGDESQLETPEEKSIQSLAPATLAAGAAGRIVAPVIGAAAGRISSPFLRHVVEGIAHGAPSGAAFGAVREPGPGETRAGNISKDAALFSLFGAGTGAVRASIPNAVAGESKTRLAPAAEADAVDQHQAAIDTHEAYAMLDRARARAKEANDITGSPTYETQADRPPEQTDWSVNAPVAPTLDQMLQDKYGIVSWAKKEHTPEQVTQQHKLLGEELGRRGYVPTEQRGHYDGEEPSYFVPGMSMEDAVELGRRGNQESIITNEGYVDLGKNTVSKPTGIEYNNEADNYYSEIELGGKPQKYQVQYDFDNPSPLAAQYHRVPLQASGEPVEEQAVRKEGTTGGVVQTPPQGRSPVLEAPRKPETPQKGTQVTSEPVLKSFGKSSKPTAITARLTTPDGNWVTMLDPQEAAKIPGLRGEEKKIDQARVDELAESMKKEGFREGSSVAIEVDANGKPFVFEGNHRIRAAAKLGIPVPAEVKYLGNSETLPNRWQPKMATSTKDFMANPERGAINLPALKKPAVLDALQKLVAPASRSTEAQDAAQIVRARTGQNARENEIAQESLKELRDQIGGLHTIDRFNFVDDIETGGKTSDPALQPVADVLRKSLDETRDKIRALGTGKLDHFIRDYFPHIWEQPQQAAGIIDQILGKRPLEGSKGFLKQRTIPTTKDGIAAGLVPVSDNPVDLVLLKLREMNKYLMGQQIMEDYKTHGIAQFVKAGHTAPQGWVAINDKVATVYGPRTSQGAMTIRGAYYAPEHAATIINNYLSPGWVGNPVYDLFRGVGNTLNQAQLGLSFFHLGFTSVDAATSKVALAFYQGSKGDIGSALKSLAESPLAPVSNIVKGNKLFNAYLKPGSEGPEYAALADAVAEAGGRIKQDSFYRTGAPKAFMDALKGGKPLKAAGKILPAILETAAKPIMEYVVPRQKLGVFADLAQYELKKLPPNATEAQRRAVLTRAWDSVDNRMGQLVYDNLFWNKVLKDVSMLGVRSVGWNLGTIRELGGGGMDLARGKFTPKASYAVALPVTVAMMGAVMTYLYTGSGPREMKDYFFPRTGRKDPDGNEERVELPSYVKDVISYANHPWDTAVHKLHPMAGAIISMLENKDYWGDKIRNEDDPWVEQLKQESKYVLDQFEPFGIRNMREETTRDQSTVTKLAPLIGVTPAKRDVVRTEAQNKMQEYINRRSPGNRTPEEVGEAQMRMRLRQGLRKGETSEADIRDLERSGQLTRRQGKNLMRSTKEVPIVGKFKQLTLDEAERVFELGNEQEQELWLPLLQKKRRTRERELRRARGTSNGFGDDAGDVPDLPDISLPE